MDRLPHKEDSEFLSVKELAQRLRLSSSAVYGWAEAGLIPHYKVGKKIIFRWAEVEEWLKTFHQPGHTARQSYHSPLPKLLGGVK